MSVINRDGNRAGAGAGYLPPPAAAAVEVGHAGFAGAGPTRDVTSSRDPGKIGDV